MSFRWRIIAAALLALALAGCDQALRLAYQQGPTLAYWWLDGYVDFDDAQKPRVRAAIAEWFRWHRREELPRLLPLLQRAQAQVQEPAQAAAACAWVEEGRARLRQGFQQAVPALAELARTLTPEQVGHIERKFRKINDKFRDENLQRDPQARREATLKRIRERAQRMYGPLDRAQREWLAAQVAASPHDPERWYAERVARQQDIVQTLRSVVAARELTAREVQARVAALGERVLRSPRPDYRAYEERLTAYNCELVAQLHNRTTAAQRRHAVEKFQAYEEDVRALIQGDARPVLGEAAP